MQVEYTYSIKSKKKKKVQLKVQLKFSNINNCAQQTFFLNFFYSENYLKGEHQILINFELLITDMHYSFA